MLGYRDLFESDWLNAILSWQRHSRGCWPTDEPFITRRRRRRRLVEHFTRSARLGKETFYAHYDTVRHALSVAVVFTCKGVTLV